MMRQRGWYVNIDSCIGCRTCELACKDKKDLPVGPRFRRVVDQEGGRYPNPWAYHVSLSCNHCEHPACRAACPVGAIIKRKKDGVVFIDQELCIGCRRCEWACPYGAPQFNPLTEKVDKCDFCRDLLDRGKNPACVDACIMRVLESGDLEELRKRPGVVGRIRSFADPRLTGPSIVFRPHPRSRCEAEACSAAEAQADAGA